jgi:hypothetical protein
VPVQPTDGRLNGMIWINPLAPDAGFSAKALTLLSAPHHTQHVERIAA